MKAGKKNIGPKQTELKGKVVTKKFGKGTKSEHNAIYLESDQGSFVLRRIGGNPFSDPALKKWIGKQVKVIGIIDQHTFMAGEIVEEG